MGFNYDFVGSGLSSNFNTYKRREKGKMSAGGLDRIGPDIVEPKFYQRRRKREKKNGITVSVSDTVVETRGEAV